MIYVDNQFVFVHIPRTSGLSICKTFLANYTQDQYCSNVILGKLDSKLWRHSLARNIKPFVTEWDVIDKFTIIRNPWRLIESMYCHLNDVLLNQNKSLCFLSNKEAIIRIQFELNFGFEHFVLNHCDFLQKGYYHHWCMDNDQELGVQCLKYEEIAWKNLCQLLRLPAKTKREVVNTSNYVFTAKWTSLAIDFVRERCQMDFEKFDYPTTP